MMFGAIADDVTGATDLGSTLRRRGARVVQTLGAPRIAPPATDAIVVATKARMLPVAEACDTVAKAADFLTEAGAERLYLKYCSTFDSTAQGNIGPMIDLLLNREGEEFTVACPSYPALGRTVYQGHLFVHEQLLSASPMRNHPLTPMLDPNIVRFLGLQSESAVGLLPLADVERGPEAILQGFDRLARQGIRIAIADAISDRHVQALGEACQTMRLATGGAAFGAALGGARLKTQNPAPMETPPRTGAVCLLSGSCSAATLAQVAFAKDHGIPSFHLDPLHLAASSQYLDEAVNWAIDRSKSGGFLLYSTSNAATVSNAQEHLGRDQAADSLEQAFAIVARELADVGVRNFVVAGGETSGAVTNALDIRMMSFGAELAPGVPWTYSLDPEGFALALKSGNFGAEDFFVRALERDDE
jgi:uncharacterized protein YgbK (DUF1537 family)